jgi:TRAP-type mannitol/chloroaromatic compound transport system substrate-binding protein
MAAFAQILDTARKGKAMDRRSFLKSAGLAGGAAVAAPLAAPAIAQGVQEIRLVTSWPANFPGLGTGANDFAERVTSMSDGRLRVRVFAGGELVGPLGVNDAVQEGSAEMYHSADYYFQGKSRAYNFFTSVPLGFTSFEMDAWIQQGGGQELWDELGGNFGIKHLPGGNTGNQAGGWFRREITSPDDFSGLRMRIPGIGGEVIAALGGTPVALAGGEILPALQAGTIDAAEWVGPLNDLAFGFHRVLTHYYTHGIHEPGSMISIGISRRLWDDLSDGDRKLIESAALATNNKTTAYFTANNAQALEQLRQEGVQLHTFNEEVFGALAEAGEQVMADMAAGDELTGRVYESFIDFRRRVVPWTEAAELAYMQARQAVGV